MAKLMGSAIVFGTALALSACSREQGPSETVEQAMKSLSKNAPQEIWEQLPKSYQSEINDGVRKIGERLDTALVSAVTDFVTFVADTLEKNREKLLESPDIARLSGDTKLRGEVFDSTIACVRDIAKSEISSTARMKAFDGGAFMKQLAGASSKFAGAVSKLQPGDTYNKQREHFAKAKVNLIAQTDSTATVELEVPELPKRKVELVKVEGKWIPKELQSNWSSIKDGLAKAEQQVDALNKQKDQVIPALTMGRAMVEASIMSGKIPPIGLSQFTRAFGNALGEGMGDPTKAAEKRLRSDIRNAATSEEAYFVDNESYASCGTAAECSAVLPGLRLSAGHELKATATKDGFELVGRSEKLPGVELVWNSSMGGFMPDRTVQ